MLPSADHAGESCSCVAATAGLMALLHPYRAVMASLVASDCLCLDAPTALVALGHRTSRALRLQPAALQAAPQKDHGAWGWAHPAGPPAG